MGLMTQARQELQRRIEEAEPGDRVASVRTLSAAVGNLATSSTVAVLQEAIDDGWIYSTRGPKGGYWRTEKVVTAGLGEAIADLERLFQETLSAMQTVRTLIATQS